MHCIHTIPVRNINLQNVGKVRDTMQFPQIIKLIMLKYPHKCVIPVYVREEIQLVNDVC